MSRLVKRDSQGSAFAIIACVESISLLAASSIFNLVYSNTVHVFPGAVFFVGVGIQVMFFILAWLVLCLFVILIAFFNIQSYRLYLRIIVSRKLKEFHQNLKSLAIWYP